LHTQTLIVKRSMILNYLNLRLLFSAMRPWPSKGQFKMAAMMYLNLHLLLILLRIYIQVWIVNTYFLCVLAYRFMIYGWYCFNLKKCKNYMQQRIWIQRWPTFVLGYRGNISLNLFTFVAGIKIIISLPCLHIFCFQLCRNETEKKLNKLIYWSTAAILDIQMANYFTLNGYSLWGNNYQDYKIRKTIKTNILNALCVLVIFSVFTSGTLVF